MGFMVSALDCHTMQHNVSKQNYYLPKVLKRYANML